jgi:hypothetical protein
LLLILFLGQYKSAGVDDILGIIIKGSSGTLVPVPEHVLNLYSYQQYFPTLWKQTTVIPIFSKGNS